jgi:two-component system response regulator FlrC
VSAPAVRPAPPEPGTTLVAASAAMRELLEAAEDVAATSTTVLLLGESGTGKELLARHLHAGSGRTGPWVAVNCAALPAELLESELFGHERGAFTGATERRQGRFEQAHRGTLLLDEISELPLPLQAKLLRVLQEREVDRVGGQRPVPVDVRVIATTNRDLGEMVRRGQFRSDLFFRLDVFPMVVPPLRERADDLPLLATALAEEAAARLGRATPALSPEALSALRRHSFPGNVRELRNLLERAVLRCRGARIEPHHLGLSPALGGAAAPAPAELPLDLSTLERMAIAEALRRVQGNRTHAARLLGIGLRTLRNKLREAREAGAPLEAGGAAEPAAGQDSPGPATANPADGRPALRARAWQGEGAA